MAAALALALDGAPDVGAKLTITGSGFQSNTVHASLTTALAGANNDLVFTAVALGTPGNAITVAYVDPGGTTAALSVVVVGNAITVNLARAASAISTIASDIIAAIIASAPASALVTVANAAANNGTGLVIAMGATNLTGGVDAAFVDVAVVLPGLDSVLNHHIATDGSGNITVPETIELDHPGTVTVTGTVGAVLQATATQRVFSD